MPLDRGPCAGLANRRHVGRPVPGDGGVPAVGADPPAVRRPIKRAGAEGDHVGGRRGGRLRPIAERLPAQGIDGVEVEVGDGGVAVGGGHPLDVAGVDLGRVDAGVELDLGLGVAAGRHVRVSLRLPTESSRPCLASDTLMISH